MQTLAFGRAKYVATTRPDIENNLSWLDNQAPEADRAERFGHGPKEWPYYCRCAERSNLGGLEPPRSNRTCNCNPYNVFDNHCCPMEREKKEKKNRDVTLAHMCAALVVFVAVRVVERIHDTDKRSTPQ
mmetsp:Transcript_3177/g.6063  ORF Transcript_3177/g.6063 Transcript_3177/m.6063 type:complete len:129 (+) Transcript_3177:114-500(+)